MDKRKYLGYKTYSEPDGSQFTVNIYRKSNNNGVSLRIVYGQMEVYCSTYTNDYQIDHIVSVARKKYPDRIITRPYMKEGVYAYILGKKKYFTSDPKNMHNDTFFYVPSNVKDPVTRYKKLFLEYLKPHLVEVGKRMNQDLSDYKIRTGLFLSYYAVCFPTKRQFKFDYRLFAYKPEISDAIVIHEIAHTYEIHHNDRFYTIVKMYCPNYDELEKEINQGRFEGRIDNYVF
ncbi:MAG: YgjP-like metallopeptidase domain-containing protein [Bacilli bacterium]|jgi:predicted metal-dependent hydrolase